jgi:hypothetical protein
VARTDSHFRLRVPDPLRDRIKAVSAQNRRSMNAEIIVQLERAFPEPTKIGNDPEKNRTDEALTTPSQS